MKTIADLVVRIADLAEAEGRSLRDALRNEGAALRASVSRMGLNAAVLVIGIPLICAGLGLLAAGAVLGLEPVVGRAGANAITGVGVLGAGALCLWIFHRNTNR